MKARRWNGPIIVLAGLFSLAVTAHGQDEVKLEWKAFQEKGKSFYQEIKTNTKQEMTVMKLKFEQIQDQTFLIKWTPTEIKDGKITLEQEIVGVKMELNIGGNKIVYDSSKEDQPKNPMTQFFQALQKAKFTLTVDEKTLAVEKVEGTKDLIKELAKVNKSMEKLLEIILSEETVKEMANPVLGITPKDGTVPKDKKWGGKAKKLDMGPIGTYTTTTNYEYKGENKNDKKLAEIGVDTKLEYTKPSSEVAKKGNLPFEITAGQLKSTEGSGTILFNKDKGRLESSDLSVKLKGSLTVAISGMETEVEIDQTQDIDLKTFDKMPSEWEKKAAK